MARKLWKLMLPFFGFLFLSAYIRSATVDVIYTDYTRLVTTYLENVFSFAPYMGADIFTRMPLSYLQRIVNVLLFGYSTTFDMLLGAFSLSLTAYIIGKYMMERGYSIAAYLLCMLLVFFPEQVGNADQRQRLDTFFGDYPLCGALLPF